MTRNSVKESVNDYGTALSLVRREHGLSQRQLAKQIGVSHVYLSQVERGNQPPLTLETTRSVIDALGTTKEQRASLMSFYCEHCGARR